MKTHERDRNGTCILPKSAMRPPYAYADLALFIRMAGVQTQIPKPEFPREAAFIICSGAAFCPAPPGEPTGLQEN